MAVNAGPFREAVKLIYGYLTVLAITNSVREFAIIGMAEPAHHLPFTTSPETWVAFVFSVILILRFFFGNVAHFNSDEDNDPFEIIFDSVIILLQAILLGYATFFIGDISKFFSVVLIILLSDLAWYVVSIVALKIRNKPSDIDRRVGLSQIVTIVTLLVYYVLNFEIIGWSAHLLITDFGPSFISIIVSFGLVNTLLDLYNNGKRYVNFREPRS